MLKLNLYTTSHCHLCEQAEAILKSIMNDYDISWISIEITDNDQLLEAYGTKIPVINVIGTNTELAWPFDRETVLTHITQKIPNLLIKNKVNTSAKN